MRLVMRQFVIKSDNVPCGGCSAIGGYITDSIFSATSRTELSEPKALAHSLCPRSAFQQISVGNSTQNTLSDLHRIKERCAVSYIYLTNEADLLHQGGKNRRRGKNENDDDKRELVFREDGQEYAQVTKMLGNGRLEAQCFDGEKRLAHIRGKMRKKVCSTGRLYIDLFSFVAGRCGSTKEISSFFLCEISKMIKRMSSSNTQPTRHGIVSHFSFSP